MLKLNAKDAKKLLAKSKPVKKKKEYYPVEHCAEHCVCMDCRAEYKVHTSKQLWYKCPACGCESVRTYTRNEVRAIL